MITLLMSLAINDAIMEYIGIILSVLEIIIVALTIISYFVPPESKFGKILSKILIGLYKTKSLVKDIDETNKEEGKEDEPNTK